LKMRITLPSVSEAKRIIAGISRTGIVMYLAQILYMVWQRAGILVLGLVALPAEAGYFTFALFYGLRMEMLCEAIGQINLPVMTRKYASEPGSFKVEVKNNFKKIFCLLYCVSVFMICFSREAVEYLVGNKYAQSLPVLPLLVLSFFLYSMLYFWVRSVLLPSSNRRIIGVSFVIMVVVTCLAVVLLAMAGKGTGGAAWGTFMGVACAVWYAGAMLHRKCDIRFIDGDILLIVLSGIPLLIVSVLGAGTSLKAVLLMADALLLLKILDDKGIFVLKRMFSR